MSTTQETPVLDRKDYLGSSDIAAILGLSKFKTALDVWQHKVHGETPMESEASTKAMNRGKRLEPYILDMLAEEHGIHAAVRNQRYAHPMHSFVRAEIDAETQDGWNIEAKTVHPFTAKEWGDPSEGEDAIPTYYLAQIHYAMLCRPAQGCIVAALIGDDLRVYRVAPNEAVQEKLLEKAVAFWKTVQSQTPPAPSTLEDAAKLWATDNGAGVEADSDTLETMNRLRTAKAEAKALDEIIEGLELKVKTKMGENTSILADGETLATWKAQEASRLDTTAFKKAHPAIAAEFTKKTQSRVFRIKER